MTNQVEETKEKVTRVKLTPEEVKANRAAAAKRTLEKRKANGVAAKQFFIHKSLFKEAEEVMAPILAKSKAIVLEQA
jgi:hypothetical protein